MELEKGGPCNRITIYSPQCNTQFIAKILLVIYILGCALGPELRGLGPLISVLKSEFSVPY